MEMRATKGWNGMTSKGNTTPDLQIQIAKIVYTAFYGSPNIAWEHVTEAWKRCEDTSAKIISLIDDIALVMISTSNTSENDREALAQIQMHPDVWADCELPTASDYQKELIVGCYEMADKIIAAGWHRASTMTVSEFKSLHSEIEDEWNDHAELGETFMDGYFLPRLVAVGWVIPDPPVAEPKSRPPDSSCIPGRSRPIS